MGIIDSLSTGYRILGYRWHLLIVPIVLDFILWASPRLSVASLFNRLAAFYNEAASIQEIPAEMASEITTLTKQVSDMLTEIGSNFNLLDLLVSSSLLHVPSMMVMAGSPVDGATIELVRPSTVIGLVVLCGLLSVLIGTIYLGVLSLYLPSSSVQDGNQSVSIQLNSNVLIASIIRQWGRVILFILLLFVTLIALYIPLSIGLALLFLLSPALGSGFAFLLGGVMFVLFFYLYFVTIGLIVDDLSIRTAISRSFRVVRNSFWSTLGLVLLINLISLGFGLILAPLATNYQPIGTLLAIVGNAYIGSGLTLALLVFYHSRRELAINEITSVQ